MGTSEQPGNSPDAPLGDAPLGDVPPGDVPPGDVPPGDVPPGDVPPGDVPPSDVPPSDVPPSDVPLSEVPLSEVPLSEVPLSEVPLSEVPPLGPQALRVLDTAVGASLLAAAVAQTVGRRVGGALSPVRHRVGGAVNPVAVVILRPPMLAERYQPATWLDGLAERGGRQRAELERQLMAVVDWMVPAVAAEVLKRIDVAGMAEGVIAEVDLAEIIRQSSGSVASDTVRGVRMQGISGDQAVGRVVARLKLRRGRKDPKTTPTQP
ncbi:hypothetical protein OG555_36420 [Kribbella sp. NBC_01484]|nr:hypothetical protein [Kribbella sp. NBC_01484]